MAEQLKMGILGVGGIAQIAHLPALRKAANVRLTAICDAAQDLLGKMGRTYDVASLYTDHRKFLDEADIDAVLIPVAHAFHAPLSIDAMRAGKHVLVEKPMAVTLEECRRMVQVSKETGRQLQVACMKRYDPGLQFAQRFVREEMGERLSVSGWYCDSVYHMQYVNSLAGPREGGAMQRRPTERIEDVHLNMVLGHGVHLIDTLRFFGGNIVAVTTEMTQKDHDIVSVSLLEFADGARGTAQLMVRVRMDWCEGLMVHGVGGSVMARIPFPYRYVGSDVNVFDARREEYRTPPTPDADPYERQLEAFASAIIEGRSVSPNAEDGLADQRVLLGMHESQKLGRRIETA
ncbi:MAG: Gfo/Idh/MocA family oxidoreductase [Planctomycetes bacterium]|nr:Gfo/Idh/MocA family oxidoreductase [Planctomycetota bacterium]